MSKYQLSFCIPTYKRCEFLIKNLYILISQIAQLEKQNFVEICISDNASPDNTETEVKRIIEDNPQINIRYSKHKENLGPDKNFINVMKMASGEYSILWGDDDFLKDNGLSRIFYLIENNSTISFFLSSVTVNQRGLKIEKYFLREDIDTYKVDFSNEIETRAYCSLIQDMGALLSFISAVVYKTSIVTVDFDNRFIGTHYAFLFYWWNFLFDGNVLLYSKESYLIETYQYQPAYGYGVKRIMIDYIGFTMVANTFIKNDRTKKDFLSSVNVTHSFIELRYIFISDPKGFVELLEPKLVECCVPLTEIQKLKESTSFKRIFISLFVKLMHRRLIVFFKKLRRG